MEYNHLMESFIVMVSGMCVQDASPIYHILDEKLSKTLGYSETILNHLDSVEQRKALFDIVCNSKPLSSLDIETPHNMYLNLFKSYSWWTQKDVQHHMKDVMLDFVLNDEEIELLREEIDLILGFPYTK